MRLFSQLQPIFISVIQFLLDVNTSWLNFACSSATSQVAGSDPAQGERVFYDPSDGYKSK